MVDDTFVGNHRKVEVGVYFKIVNWLIYNLKLHKSRTMRFWLINGAVVGAVFDQKSDIQHFRSLRGVKCNGQDHPFLS